MRAPGRENRDSWAIVLGVLLVFLSVCASLIYAIGGLMMLFWLTLGIIFITGLALGVALCPTEKSTRIPVDEHEASIYPLIHLRQPPRK